MKQLILLASAAFLFVASCAAEDSTKVEPKKETAKEETVSDSTAKTDSTEIKEPAKEESVSDSTAKTDSTETKEPEIITTELGVIYQDLVVGEGKECAIGSNVLCHYTLWLGDSAGVKGKRIQSSKDGGGKPYQCRLGYQLIAGWSDGMVGMKEGGTRQLVIKPELGYGKGGGGGGQIPPNQWLVFEIDLVRLLP